MMLTAGIPETDSSEMIESMDTIKMSRRYCTKSGKIFDPEMSHFLLLIYPRNLLENSKDIPTITSISCLKLKMSFSLFPCFMMNFIATV